MSDKIKLNVAVLTISDSRIKETDKSGDLLKKLIGESGHIVVEQSIVKDCIYSIRKTVSSWIENKTIDVVISLSLIHI